MIMKDILKLVEFASQIALYEFASLVTFDVCAVEFTDYIV